jgi:hypothetical protein
MSALWSVESNARAWAGDSPERFRSSRCFNVTRGGQYLVGTPRSKLKEFEKTLLEGDWKQIQEEVEVKLVSLPAGTET